MIKLLKFSFLLILLGLIAGCAPVPTSYYLPEKIGPMSRLGCTGPFNQLTLMHENKAGYRVWLGERAGSDDLILSVSFQAADKVKARLLDTQVRVKGEEQSQYQVFELPPLKRYLRYENGRSIYETILPSQMIVGSTRTITGWFSDDIRHFHKAYHGDVVLPLSLQQDRVEVLLPSMDIDGYRFVPAPIKFESKFGIFIHPLNC